MKLPGGLARRLLLRVLLFSLCFTVLASAAQLYFEYRREMREIEARLELIRVGYLASFERSLWDLNQEQLNVQLRGLADFPDIAQVRLRSADFNLVQDADDTRGPFRTERYALAFQPPDGERRDLGELEVGIDLGAVYRRLLHGGLTSLLWMGSVPLRPGGGTELAVPQPGYPPPARHGRIRPRAHWRQPGHRAGAG